MANLAKRKYEFIGAAADLTTYFTEQEVVLSANTKAPSKTLRSIKTKAYTAGADGNLEVQLSGIAAPTAADLFVLSLSAKAPLDNGQKMTERFRITGVSSINSLKIKLGEAIAASSGSSYSAANYAGAGTTLDIIEAPISPLTAGELDLWGAQSATGAIDIPGFKLSKNGEDITSTVTIAATNVAHATPVGSPKTLARDLSATTHTIIGTVPAAASAETYDVIELQYEDVYTHGNPVSGIKSGLVIDTVYVAKSTITNGDDIVHYKEFAAGVEGYLGLGAGGSQTLDSVTTGTLRRQLFSGGVCKMPSAGATHEVCLPTEAPVGTVGILYGSTATAYRVQAQATDTVNGSATFLVGAASTSYNIKKIAAGTWTMS